jgi:uncharacterized protein
MTTAHDVLRDAQLYTDDTLYSLIHLPAGAITAAAGVLAEIGTPFSAMIADKDEVSLLLPQEDWENFAHRLPDHQAQAIYRLITFDLVLDMDLIGFLALVSQILAEAGVPLLALSAFERDHVLVRADQFEVAWAALRRAQTGES